MTAYLIVTMVLSALAAIVALAIGILDRDVVPGVVGLICVAVFACGLHIVLCAG